MIPDRILNPKKLFTEEYLGRLPVVDVDGTLFRKLVRDERRIVTSCQCFGDCSCRGSITGGLVEYFRRKDYDGTDKAFYTDPKYTPKIYERN